MHRVLGTGVLRERPQPSQQILIGTTMHYEMLLRAKCQLQAGRQADTPSRIATCERQANELVQQLRGQAEARQVEGARLALQHNLGLGGACVVTMYQAA